MRDPQWGPVLAVGLGGIWVEVLKDSTLHVLPVSHDRIKQGLLSLRAAKIFAGARGTEPADIVSAFDDHATILGLGLGSVLNIPVVFEGRCVGTMNLLHQAGWYRADDERTGLTLAAFLIPALLSATNTGESR